MNNFRKALAQNIGIRFLSSLKLTAVCLVLLFILTLWGTIAQVSTGLYLAQERFFNSWYFLALDFFPFPGARLVLWIMFVNLSFAFITKFVFCWRNIGLLITHLGLFCYFLAAFVTFHSAKESHITLLEGETTNVSAAYSYWEVSLWPETNDNRRDITAYTLYPEIAGKTITLDPFGATLEFKKYYPNAEAYTTSGELALTDVINAAGINYLKPMKRDKEPSKNLPGGIFILKDKTGQTNKILLYGGEDGPTKMELNGETYNIQLRRRRFALPFLIKLNDFQKEVHPGTEVARAFQSYVTVEHDGLSRDVKIYMNNPFRFKDFTLYQSSYSVDKMGRERSTFAVVENKGRLLPYIACFITFFGLAWHFWAMGFGRRKKKS